MVKLKDRQLLRGKTIDELKALVKKKKDELFELRLEKSQHKLKNTRLLFLTRKEIALILTIIHERGKQI